MWGRSYQFEHEHSGSSFNVEDPQRSCGSGLSRKRPCDDHPYRDSNDQNKRRRLDYRRENDDHHRSPQCNSRHPYMPQTPVRRDTSAQGKNRSRQCYDSPRKRQSGSDKPHSTQWKFSRSYHKEESSSLSERVRQPVIFGYKRLERMSLDDDKSVLYELAGAESSLEETLNQNEIRRDLMTLLLRVLAKACSAGDNDAPENTIIVLSVVKTSTFLKEHLLQHISKMKNSGSSLKVATLEDNFRNCIMLFRSLLKHLPSTRDQVGVLLDLITNASNTLIKQGEEFDQKIIDDVEDLQEQQAISVINAPEDEKKRSERMGYSPAVEPPNDFREFPIFPTLEELSVKQAPYLRQNVVRGKYRDLQHYLDVQFRLMREDFVAPLREGIAEIQAGFAQNKKMRDIRVYSRVRFLYPVCTNNSIVYRIQFDCSYLRGIRWFASKRLLHGSLVCLSCDDFKTAIFGTVANREPRHLVQGILDVDFRDDVRHFLNTSQEFAMVESIAFFEAYRHVLEGLKEITEDSLPFKKHILKISPQVDQPQYLQDEPDMIFDLRKLLKDGCPKTEACDVTLLERKTWPSPRHMQLDQSQLQAVYTALTTNFSVIQGPPGTGKTHVGLKIMQVLLENRLKWGKVDVDTPDSSTGPILVVCYTNHALDQFLEGVLDFNKRIVRVGRRSKSERLSPYNLDNIRSDVRMSDDADRSLKNCRNRHRKKAMKIRLFIETKTNMFQQTFNGVITTTLLAPFLTKTQQDSLSHNGGINPGDSILYWLDLTNELIRYREEGDSAYRINRNKVAPSSKCEVEEDAFFDVEDFFAEERDVDDDEIPCHTQMTDSNDKNSPLAFDIQSFTKENARISDEKEKQAGYRIANRIQEQVDSTAKMTSMRANEIQDVWMLPFDERWNLYRYWVACFRQKLIEDVLEKVDSYNNTNNALKEVMDQEDYQILKDCDVIGMTTTRAAKNRALLQRVKPRIIIIEEAAEILESHIVTTLSKHCLQLILIGDHQQLRPNPTVYRLTRDYNLDISLFERMVKNDLPCQRLSLQHRMRPDISIIMKKHFYPKLQDHDSVMKMFDVQGVCSNVYFIDHSYQESADTDTRSRSNIHEASFLVAFCRYLLQQGYDPSKITILTSYTGQLLNFRQLMNKKAFEGVRTSVVDNFQGEENDIILLSLVRSNDEGSIGFLKVANRVCVALSRAKQGLFCIGNFEQLGHQSDLWKKIITTMRLRKLIGSSLPLLCARHPQIKNEVSSDNDFKRVPEGGCRRPCEFRLECGHVCAMPCHPKDPEHLQYRCMKRCSRKLCKLGHTCRNTCCEACERVCRFRVDKVLPRCGHTNKVPCHSNPDFMECRSKCGKTLKCGHVCTGLCGELCDKTPCKKLMKRDLPCGHSAILSCSAPSDACPVPCNTILRCGHPCTGTCGVCLRGRLHKACTQRCGRILVCGHTCKEPCIRTCPPCKRPCENRCKHSKCKRTCGEPCTPCQERCEWKCRHKKCSNPCGDLCDRDVCNKACPEKIPAHGRTRSSCRHPCIGVCGEPCPEKCRFCDRREVTEILLGSEEDNDAKFIRLEDCGHLIEVGGLDHWMHMADESQTGESVSIQMKGCPKCKTPIRRNLRYGNIIKKILADIEKVKSRVRGNLREIIKNKEEAKIELKGLEDTRLMNEDLAKKLTKQLEKQLGLQELVCLRNEMSLYGLARRLELKLDDAEDCRDLRRQLQLVQQRLFNEKQPMRGSDQEIDEFTFELERLHLCWQICKVNRKLSDLHDDKKRKVQEYVKNLSFLMDGKPLLTDERDKAKNLLEKCCQHCGGLDISETERQMIVRAIGLSKGHWFKCPNEHFYAIGECGGATVEGQCPECHATIGGSDHRLRADNSLAPEIDGDRHDVW